MVAEHGTSHPAILLTSLPGSPYTGGVSSSACGRDVPGSSHTALRRTRVMPTGTIARLLIDKGFGFIRDEGGIEHFFHRSSVRGAVFELLREGQRVEFTPE